MESFAIAQQTLAHNVRTKRRGLGLSQETLAFETGINRTFVSQIERAIGNPSLNTLCRLANRLGVTEHELLMQKIDTNTDVLTANP